MIWNGCVELTMYMFGDLSLQEKTAIMGVLSTDRLLRETEEERIMKLRIELARERRAGAVISGEKNTMSSKACARCRKSVGLMATARCPVCKHIICKECRVFKLRGTENGGPESKETCGEDLTLSVRTSIDHESAAKDVGGAVSPHVEIKTSRGNVRFYPAPNRNSTEELASAINSTANSNS